MGEPKNKSTNLVVSNNPSYTFGFTGFKTEVAEFVEEEPDEFDTWARETRKAAGIIDPDPEPTFTVKRKLSGQILWSGKITIPAPRYSRTVIGIDNGRTGLDNDSD